MFPSNPNVGDTFTTSDGRVFEWDGTRWVLKESPGGGGSGSTGKVYTHTQITADTDWDVIHNLDHRLVLVQVVSSAGNTVIPDVTYDTANRVAISFANPMTGTAVIRY